jgi:hypothetical protein
MPSALLPDLLKEVLTHYAVGRRADAAAAYAQITPLFSVSPLGFWNAEVLTDLLGEAVVDFAVTWDC